MRHPYRGAISSICNLETRSAALASGILEDGGGFADLKAAIMDLGIVGNVPDLIGGHEHEAGHDRKCKHVVVEEQR